MAKYFLVWDADVGVFGIYVSDDAPERTMYPSVGTAEEAMEQYKGIARKEFKIEARPSVMSFDSLDEAMEYQKNLLKELPFKPKYDTKYEKEKYKKGGGK